ncbi:hypothetical protein K523DRAFT_367538 [Schizophyllum commune Tattone D]|nr:hypothetical protein K523DRAFT_367538 [Schizophyllum commune Tattone D]
MPITLDQVQGWFTKHYPKPSVDPQWLQECFEWVLDAEKPPTLQDAIASVETQLLSSDLQVSMLPGTGIPIHHEQPDTWTLAPGKTPGVLVQITALTEIGQSAWSLNEVRVAREERMRGAPTVNQDTEDDGNVGADDEDEGPMPSYPRSMLKFEVSDGHVTMPAIEYKPLKDLKLGDTKLGFKMILKNVSVNRGIAFLTPESVTLKGYQAEDLEEQREAAFARSLHARMHPDEDPDAQDAAGAPPPPPPAPAPAVRSPLRAISPPPSPPPMQVDENLPRPRRLPAHHTRDHSPGPPVPAEDGTLPIKPLPKSRVASISSTSQYFPPSSSSTAVELPLSPTHTASGSRPPPIPPSAVPRARTNGHADTRASSAATESTLRNTSARPPSDSEDEFDLMSDGLLNDEVFAMVDAVSQAAHIPSHAAQNPSHTAHRQHTTREQATTQATTRLMPDIIDVSDSEADEKENVPVEAKRARRRVDAVIDISDSE